MPTGLKPAVNSCLQLAQAVRLQRSPKALVHCSRRNRVPKPCSSHRRQVKISSQSQTESDSSQPRPGYRKNVGVCLCNQQGLVFAGRRPNVDAPWQLPQGGIDDGETPAEAAARELKEETGISQASIIAQADGWLDYDFPAGHRGWGNYPGQTQMWFLMLYHGDESDINLDQHDPPEFDSFQWMSLRDLPSQVVPFKRKIYVELHRQFTPIIASNSLGT